MQKIRAIYLDKNKRKKLLLLCGSFFLTMIVLITLVSVSLAALTPTESIEIVSENLNYGNNENGSWKIKKSATWISNSKIKVSYDISTVAKEKASNVDLLLVVNTSNSLSDEQFSAMKSDLNEFVDGILTDSSSSRVSLLSFNSNYSIVSDFSNDKNTIINGINNLTMATGASYYKGFQGIDAVLNDYQAVNGNNLVVIFVTSCLPNKDMPNENAKYNYLKVKYSNLVINAITYNMSSSIPEKVMNISDNQFIANSNNLSNVLFNAADMQYSYDEFTIDDYIDTNNFNIDNLNSLRTDYGSAVLDNDDDGKKVSINLNNLVSGSSVNISYEMNLVNTSDTDKIFAVNKDIKVNSSITESLENIVSAKTPVLADTYKVSYISNAPNGCSVTVPSAKSYSVFDKVKINDNLVCDGYQFRGWKLVSDKNITMINDDNFLMPEADVSVKGTWSKLSINKSMDGTVYTPQTLNNIIENQAVLDNTSSEFVTASTGIDFSEISSDTNGKGVYTMASTKDDDFPIHYYRGAVTNNHVKYAGFCWKIVRTTETGGVKLVYSGSPNSSTGACGSGVDVVGNVEKAFSSDSLTSVGYMYGDRYDAKKNMNNTWYSLNGHPLHTKNMIWYVAAEKTKLTDTGVAATALGSKRYYFARSYTYDSSTNMYTLSNASTDYVNLLHKNAEGKYTCHSTTATSCASLGYVLTAGTGEYDYISLTDGETLTSLQEQANAVRWLYGKSVTYDNETGSYTLNDTIESNHVSLASNYAEINSTYPYSCFSSSDTCSSVYYFDSIDDSSAEYVTMSNGETYDSLYANAITDQYTYMYGNDVSYDEETGMYTLSDSISSHWIDWSEDQNSILSDHHYFCENNQTSCSTVYYAFHYYYKDIYYFTLSAGEKIDDVLDTIHSNQYPSNAKTKLDEWYSANIAKYSSYLEDTVWCNDRELAPNNSLELNNNISNNLSFLTEDRLEKVSPSVLCSNDSDKFTVSSASGNGKLSYPIGLLTLDEYVLAGIKSSSNSTTSSSTYLKSSRDVVTLSPANFSSQATYFIIDELGYAYNSRDYHSVEYVVPSVSLKGGLMVYAGNGTSANPYILESFSKKITIEGNNDIKASPSAALSGETVTLTSKSGTSKIESFKLNGETITGSSFTMPDDDVLINNIVVTKKIVIEDNADIVADAEFASFGSQIHLTSKSGTSRVESFKLNGETITGSSFIMPDGIAQVSDIIVSWKIVVKGNSDIEASSEFAFPGTTVTLTSKSGTSKVESFKLNGTYTLGSSFTMPDDDVSITVESVSKKIVIEGNSDIEASSEFAFPGTTVTLTSKSGNSWVVSFDMNGETITGSSFTMPSTSVVINNIVVSNKIIIEGNSDIDASLYFAQSGNAITLSSKSGKFEIVSFKLNGETITGSSFIMPDGVATVSNIVVTTESEHNTYPSNMDEKVYAENTFEGATSLTVEITYQTQAKLFNTYYDYVSIYDKNGSNVSGKLASSSKKTETFTIIGDYIKITFTSNSLLNDYYGFKATITPNYS